MNDGHSAQGSYSTRTSKKRWGRLEILGGGNKLVHLRGLKRAATATTDLEKLLDGKRLGDNSCLPNGMAG